MTRFMHGHGPAAAAWARDELGVDPNQCGGVDIAIHPDGAVTADVKLFLREQQLKRLHLHVTGVVAVPNPPPESDAA